MFILIVPSSTLEEDIFDDMMVVIMFELLT